MKHISVLIPPDAILGGIEIVRHMLGEANRFAADHGRQPLFDICLVGLTGKVHMDYGKIAVAADRLLSQVEQTDLVIIPAIDIDKSHNKVHHEVLAAWIRNMRAAGAEVASLCVGAFLLAQTGLLENKSCTTHWKAAGQFKDLYPQIKLLREKIITDEDGIYSSGGGFCMLNLVIYLIEKYAGRDVALYCARFFQVDIDRTTPLPFVIFQSQKEHNDMQIKQAQVFIEENYEKRITVDELAEMFAMGRRSLERRFKKATANTPNEYIQRVKIEVAKKQLESSDKKINDIMLDIGYLDTNTFRTTFKTFTGLLPNEYRTKYNPNTVGL